MNSYNRADVFIANPQSDVNIDKFSVVATATCDFCSQTFETDSEKNIHILQHFPYEICIDCDKQLIRIGDSLYVLHTSMTCIKTEDPVKLERNETSVPIEPFSEISIVVKEEYEARPQEEINQQIIDFTNDVEMKIESPTAEIFAEPIQCVQMTEQNENFPNINIEHSMQSPEILNRFGHSKNVQEHQNYIEVTEQKEKRNSNRTSNAERREKHRIYRKEHRQKLIQCDFEGCGEWIKRLNKSNHMANHLGTQFICDICDKSTATKEAIRKHMRNHIIKIAANDQNDIEAKAILEKEKRRKERLKNYLNILIKCEYDGCDKWIRKSAKSRHMRRHLRPLRLEDEKFSCDICKLSFGNVKEIRAHMRIHSFYAIQNDSAIVPEMTFMPHTSKTETERMKRLIYRETIINCEINECDKTFKRKDKDAHMIQYHGKQIICDICNASFKSELSLYKHKKLHLTESIECEQCGEIMKKCNLKKHEQNVHLKIPKKFICNVCGKAFRNNTLLKEHLRMHTGEKPIACSQCDKSFRTKSLLHKHTRLHTGEKPYKCDQVRCDRAYAHYTDLKRHKYGAHGIWSKKFTCNVCTKDFPENKLLRYHMRSSHGVEC